MEVAMHAFDTHTTWTSDDFAAELTDTALGVAARHGTTDASVEVEVDLWNALATALRGPDRSCGVLGRATDAAYRTILGHRPHGSFLDLELELWAAFRNRWPARTGAAGLMAC
jgi:hypothetical protein